MRLALALIYIATGMWLYFRLGGENLHYLIGLAYACFLMISSVWVCNEGFLRRLKGQNYESYVQELVDQGRAAIETYRVSKALTFEDLSTSCLCHLLVLENGKLLCLYGQYLYDFAEIHDDREFNQVRTFPTSEFSLIRDLKKGNVLKIEPGSQVIKEHQYALKSTKTIRALGITLKDGEIINNIDLARLQQTLATMS